MKLLRNLLLTTLLAATHAGVASATPITFQLDGISITGALLPTTQFLFPAPPVIGSGNIDFGAGTGTLSLPNYFVIIDVNNDGNDANLLIAGWTQTITSIDGSGNITSTGSGTSTCTPLAGAFGALVCGAAPATVAGWPPVDGASLPSSAVLDQVAKTITVIDNSNATAGTITTNYSYSVIPEPGTAVLASLGLIGLGVFRRSQRS